MSELSVIEVAKIAAVTGDFTILELTKLIVSILTPLTVLVVGFFINRRLKSIDDAQWQTRKIVEKRIDLFDEISPNLNKIYCFCFFRGYWKDISPLEMLQAKRDLDKVVNVYRHILSENFFNSYDVFIHTAFRTFTGHGADAKIRSAISNKWADRRKHVNYTWDTIFDEMFDEDNIPTDDKIERNYKKCMEDLRDCVGL